VNEISFSYESMGNKTHFEKGLKVIRNWLMDTSKILRVLNKIIILYLDWNTRQGKSWAHMTSSLRSG